MTKRFFLLLATIAVAFAMRAETQSIPELEFVFDLDVALEGGIIEVGDVPMGERNIIPITGGTFQGPDIQGQVLPGGADYQLSSTIEGQTHVHAIYTIQTDDGISIMVDNQGVISSVDGKPYFFTTPHFEAPVNSKYAWLNQQVFICRPIGGDDKHIKLRVWRVID